MTPATQSGRLEGTTRAPTRTSEPRGSLTTAERNASYSLRNASSFSAVVAPEKSGPPLRTTRVGSPPVCESMIVTRLIGQGRRQFCSRELQAAPRRHPGLGGDWRDWRLLEFQAAGPGLDE